MAILSVLRASGVAAVLTAASAMAGGAGLPAAAAAPTPTAIASAVNSAGTWGKAIEVPGTAALNTGNDAEVLSVSCPSPGNCSAGGYYYSRRFRTQAFVVSEKHGAWAAAIKVPGTAALNKYQDAAVTAVSCPSPGDCTAGGYYADKPAGLVSQPLQPFVVTEKNGIWGKAAEIPGSAAINKNVGNEITALSCGSAGNCSAGGGPSPAQGPGDGQAFVVDENHGVWHTAMNVPGIAALNSGDSAYVNSVSCTPPGDCSAGGSYVHKFSSTSISQDAFVVTKADGKWATAIEVPGTAAFNKPGTGAEVNSVSCASPGNCAAGGSYTSNPDTGAGQAFVVTEVHGSWGKAIEVPGTSALNKGGNAQVSSVSCPSAGNCSAVGSYADGHGHVQAFVVTDSHGTWGHAIEVPGTSALNKGGNAGISSVSCASPGNCSAGGGYTDSHGDGQAFVVTESHGTWGHAIEVPGTSALNKGGSAGISSVSCASPGNCSAGGSYASAKFEGAPNSQAFVVSER
jgi:hypothetical protein